MLINNRNYLRVHHRSLMDQLVQWENHRKDNDDIQVEPTRVGDLTLKLNVEGKQQYIHSKYDPQTEAERLIAGLGSLEEYNHILFVGIGLGYHLKELLKVYPDIKVSIYEPNIGVLYQFLSHQDISGYFENLQMIFVGTNETYIRQSLYNMYQMNKNKTLIYTLPSFQKIYAGYEELVTKTLTALLKDKRSDLATNVAFQKRWTINSIKNFPDVLKTPNILHDVDKGAFKDKPAVIVAAGPSLNEEFDNLKYIKENGLAYIFSVGSAINALIENGIYPDAACTYDPTERNQIVIQKIKDKNISNIPLIFGSSVGFETIIDYPGKMLHMITSQDTISSRILDTTQDIQIVLDAASIAIITFQLLKQLGCNFIILAGQNFGYQNNERYAKGIEYKYKPIHLVESEQKQLMVIKDVYGNDMQTKEGLNNARKQLEMYIKTSPGIDVLNTTKGGAHIEGAQFVPLSEIIKDKLNSRVVEPNWYESKNSYDLEFVNQQIKKLKSAEKQCEQTFQKALDELKIIHQAVEKRQAKKMEQKFAKFDKQFNKLKNNLFYSGFIEPMVRVQNKRLSEESQLIRYETNVLKKGRIVVDSFGKFISDCYTHLQFVHPYFKELQEKVEQVKIEAVEQVTR